jgi:hypothetical protein
LQGVFFPDRRKAAQNAFFFKKSVPKAYRRLFGFCRLCHYERVKMENEHGNVEAQSQKVREHLAERLCALILILFALGIATVPVAAVGVSAAASNRGLATKKPEQVTMQVVDFHDCFRYFQQFFADLAVPSLPRTEMRPSTAMCVYLTFWASALGSAGFQPAVSRISNPPLLPLPAGCRLEVGDTADWKSALPKTEMRPSLHATRPQFKICAPARLGFTLCYD